MRLPKRLNDILLRKQAFIDAERNRLEQSVVKLQSRLLDDIITEIMPALDVRNGVILDTKNNYRLLADLDRIYKDFTKITADVVTENMSGAIGGIVDFGKRYFAISFVDLPVRFDKVISSAASNMNLRIGLDGGRMIRGGFLESLVKDTSLLTEVKNYVARSITGQIDTKDFIRGLKDMLQGVPKTIVKDGKRIITQTGALEKLYQRYAYDLYQQYDAAYNKALADEFDMNYFMYQGGLIEDSRDFCVAHNAKVWSREEADTWKNWRPVDGQYPEGYKVKQKDIYKHPGYMDYEGYNPFIDRGGYRCRHGLGWISDELAYRLRPELKKNNKKT